MNFVRSKFTFFGIFIILLAMEHNSSITTSNKAVTSLCQHTDYKQSCRKSLAHVKNTDNPKELMKIAFKSAIKEIQTAMYSSYPLQKLATDYRTSQALAQCNELLNTSIDDLNRSLKKLDNFDVANMDDEYVGDLKIWLSGSLTYQETCREGFDNTKGETGEKIKKLLSLGWKLTSNGLAMVDGLVMDNNGPDKDAWWERGERGVVVDVGLEKWRPFRMVIVGQDGSGFRTIMEAVKRVPKWNKRPFVIYIKKGVYKEHVEIPRHVDNVIFIGQGPTKTRITGSVNYDDGTPTYKTATVAINGDRFLAKDIGFENTAGPRKHQAVALRVSGDKAIFHNCAIDGYQDTLYAHSYRQFYRHCNITGTIDFVFGDAAAIFQHCMMIVKKPLHNQQCMVIAQGRKDRHSKGAMVLEGCTITADKEFLATHPMPKSYLGRPWKAFSRTIIMQSFIDHNISPKGWAPWAGSFALDTCYFGEFNNMGPRANTAKRVTWKGIKKMSAQEAFSYTPGKYIQGNLWIKKTGVPYDPGLMMNA